MIPTPGRIVEYTLGEQDAAAINKRRTDAQRKVLAPSDDAAPLQLSHLETGAQIHGGNEVAAGDTYPLVITRVWGQVEGRSVNGQVLLDGNDTFWATSVSEGDGARHWRPYPRV